MFVIDSDVSPFCVDSSVSAEAEHALVNQQDFGSVLTLLKRFTPAGHLTTSSWRRRKYDFQRFNLQGVNSTFWQQEEKEEGSCLEQEGEMKSIFI